MEGEKIKRNRRSIRLKRFDYAQQGAYFVTICTHERENLFGRVAEDEMRLSAEGEAVRDVWSGLPRLFPSVDLDEFVVMPNHVHGIIAIPFVGAQFIAPSTHGGAVGEGKHAPALGDAVRAFKAAAARRVRLSSNPEFRWQRNYYEHVVRNEDDLNRIRLYIRMNPALWAEDPENRERAR